LLKIDLGNAWLNQYSFVKLNDTWQYFFQFTIPYQTILINWWVLVGYIFFMAAAGIYVFNKRDIG
jgi:hypothetical protein